MPKITQMDVAKRAGLSSATVSRALAGSPLIPEATRIRVEAISRDVGYKSRRTARPVQLSSTLPVALLVVDRYPSENDLPMDAVAHAASEKRFDLHLRHLQVAENDPMDEAILAAAQGMKGLLLYGHITLPAMNRLADRGIPFVVIGNPAGGTEQLPRAGTIVTSDFVEMGRLATRRLIKRGHTRIGFICSMRDPGMWFDCWIRGWQLAHVETGLPADRSLLHVFLGDPLPAQKAVTSADWFADLASPPTAYVVPDLGLFVDFLHQFGEKGREVPMGNATIGGRLRQVQNYGDWPKVAEDTDSIVDMAFAQLRLMLDEGPMSSAAILRIPHRLLNFE